MIFLAVTKRWAARELRWCRTLTVERPSVEAFHLLAVAQEKAGRTRAALRSYDRVIDLVRRRGDKATLEALRMKRAILASTPARR
jgi:hypothetical protein